MNRCCTRRARSNHVIRVLMVICGSTSLLTGCHPNPGVAADSPACKTYQWDNHPNGEGPDQLIAWVIHNAVDQQLAHKGLTRAEKHAGLRAGYRAAVHEEKNVNVWGWGGAPGWWGSVEGETSNHKKLQEDMAKLLKNFPSQLDR